MATSSHKSFVRAAALYLCAACWLYGNAVQADSCSKEDAVARVVSAQGTVVLNEHAATLDDFVCAGDIIRVGSFSRAAIILLATETTVRIDQESVLRLPPPAQREQSLLDLLKGALYLFSREPPALDVYTPYLNAAVEGTEFLVRAAAERSFVTVFEGRILASNAQGQIRVGSNQTAVAEAGQAPRLIDIIRPEDAVQWALYYQPVLAALYAPEAAPEGLRRALGALDYRNPAAVIERLDQIPAADRDVFYQVFRAAWLLAVGQAEPAQAALDAVLQKQPTDGNVLALSAIIAVTRNDKAQALVLAQQAVENSPQSAATWLALSYAQQAQFDLDGALASTQAASERDPDNALVLARLSELWLSKGELDQALTVAQQAAAINPNIARTQSVLGFAYLTRIDLAQARQAFARAIELDQADPLPRLGLGLAKIRQGELEPGREDLAIAVSLDPLNSLLRSYLGKAYFEEKRAPLASTQYEIAKDLDQFDPTPWLYDALLKQAQNRPVEALQDIQKSIELNDNRAVYRSRLLLDEDEAVRSASLGRIYKDLGFGSLALVEGWKSVTTAPGDFAGHRFLADSYASLPRHEIARVSELLQSQLRQPLNATPLQPQLTESNLFVLAGTGPSDLSFNEFSQLFSRNGVTFQANGVAGGNDTIGNDAVLSTLQDNFSFSIGQFHYETEGYRENNDLTTDIYNLFVQAELSPSTSIQAELRYYESDFGDLPQRFGIDNFTADLRQDELTKSVRFGFRHVFSPSADIIGNFSFEDTDAGAVRASRTDLDVQENFSGGEIQGLYRTGNATFIVGGGRLEGDSDNTITFLNQPAPIPPIQVPAEIKSANAYFYTQLNLSNNLNLMLGASFDTYQDNNRGIDERQLNPKLGMLWNPTPTTTLRAAAFRTLRREFIADQTIEPTHIAGFNQYFSNTPSGTESKHYGAAIDHKFSNNFYSGVEYSERDIKTHGTRAGPPPENVKADFGEQLGRVYAYWTPHPWWALRAEYQFEKFDRERDIVGPEAFTELETQRLSVGANYYHPSGFSAKLQATYVDQTGMFAQGPSGLEVPGQDTFWVMDVGIGYRFAKQRGVATLVGKNIFNEEFNFQDTDPASPSISPRRIFLFKLNLFF